MAYNSAHTGPEIDAAVEMLGQIQSARDATSSDRGAVETLASQVATNASQVASQASTVSTKTAQVLASAAEVEQAHDETLSASAVAVNAKDAAALSAGSAQTSKASASASASSAAQSQVEAGLSEQVSAENAESSSADRLVVEALAQQVEEDSASSQINADSAALSALNAAAVVTGGTATIEPAPGKIPLADAQGKINSEWLGAEDLSKKLANYTAARAYSGSASRVEITQSDIAGAFNRRAFVIGDIDDNGTVLISNDSVWTLTRVVGGVVLANWFGAPSSSSIQAIFNAGAGKTVVFDGSKTYPYSLIAVAANTRVVTHGATFARDAASTSHGVTVNSCVDIDTLKLTSPGGSTGDKGVLIKGDIVSIGHLEGVAVAEGSFTSDNWLVECESRPTNTQLKDIRIGRLVSKNYRTTLFAKYVDGMQVDSISADTYRLAVYLQDVTNSNFPQGSITGKSATLTGAPGENGLLCESTKASFSMRNVRIGNWRVEDSGEHGFRLGGNLSMSDIYFDSCTSVRPGQAWTVGYPLATEWHGGCGFKVLGGTAVAGQRHKNIYFNKCNVFDCSLNSGTFPAGHGVNNFTSFLISCADNVHLTDCGADALAQTYSAKNTLLISACDGVYLNNNNMLKAQLTAISPYEENALVASGSLGLAFGVNELHVNGGVYEVTNPAANTGIPFNPTGTAYANKNWSIGGGAMLRGGRNAVYVATPTSGSYSGIIDFTFTYSGSNADDATYDKPVVDGAAIALLTVKAPWRPGAFSPSGLNGSTWQDTLGGVFRRKEGGTWFSTPNLPSGSWTPTPTNVANLTSSSVFAGRFTQQGSTVSLTGVATVTPTAAGIFQMDLTIPVPSNFSTFTDAAGTVVSDQGDVFGIVKAEVTNDRLSIVAKATAASARNIYFTASYTVK